ncbi:SpoIIE family protein phosphatase [Desulfovibrio mangrovi]|uniref:SpoIIE family protein phosphatase n=1 Tax=Desulfovibrio mangrovi TaxID=2976983 RepID=UPI002246A5B0|nr:SpoIIE family protein phosphatase [Desulfovibrio mangrovi]UZP68115.1 SpoIIE family protein phosphatase [Desulfovibrio mangrovi]
MSFTARLTLYILITTGTVFLCTFGYNYIRTERSILELTRENAFNLATGTVGRIERVLQRVEQVPRFLAVRLVDQDMTSEEVETLLREFVASTPDIYGSTIAFAPNAVPAAGKYYAPYCYRSTDGLRMVQLANDNYQYWYQDWFRLPRQAGKAIWSEPYFDEGGGNVMMTTFSVPVYRERNGRKEFYAVITADIAIDWLQKLVSDIHIYESGHAFILTQNGFFVVHPDKRLIMKADQSIYELAVETDIPQLTTLGYRMTEGKTGVMPLVVPNLQKPVEVIYTPLKTVGWSLGLVIPQDELFSSLQSQSVTVAALALAGILGISVLVWVVAHNATRPLRILSGNAVEIAQGHLDIALPPAARMDEIGRLTTSFDEMRTALKDYIADLTNTTAAKERIESELKIARNIQMSFLPKRFPPFPDREEFDIFATLTPAREVGGDLYDFFLLDDRFLFVSVGDVSDKGVPAALFMAVTKTLMKGIAEHERDPAAILQRVNEELASDNDNCMFVTLFCGLLNLQTGEFTYSNAGHDAPLLLRAGAPVTALDMPPGLVLGAMSGAPYQCRQMTLAPDDRLLLYTDGVTEAMSPDGELYSADRLRVAASEYKGMSAQALTEHISVALHAHAQECPQSDDITLLALHWHGRTKTSGKS